MSRADSAVWREFLRGSGVEFSRLDYDVSLGAGGLGEYDGDNYSAEQWAALRQKRIDVVGTTASGVWVIEVKPVANMAALGQVLTYGHLWDETIGAGRKCRRVVVGGEIDVDAPGVYQRYGVMLWRAASGDVARVV